MKYTAKVGIVIVCMNNLKNLIPCINSIKEKTSVDHEIWVNCYMFSDENLKIVKETFPEVNIVLNNVITGFSENNNIILKKLKTEYALVINDDTQIHDKMIDIMVDDLDRNQQISIISPVLYYADGSVQFCGRNPIPARHFLLEDMGLGHPQKHPSKWIDQEGLFQTYNITGACFLARMSVLCDLGYFDEDYFFCPEDIALSTLANKKGYQCWVDTNATMTHFCGQTRKSRMKAATLPAQRLGCVRFWGEGILFKTLVLRLLIMLSSMAKALMWICRRDTIEASAQWNCVVAMFSSKSTKEVFTKYYSQIKR